MSVVAVILQFIFAIFGYLFSFKGMFTFLMGTCLFLLMPFIPKALGVGRRLAHFHLFMAMWSVKRAAIVVSEHNDLLFKRMTFDDLGVEQISFGEDTKDFEDPAAALHHFFDFPFALADEESGILFDPRHAAIGQRKKEFVEKGIDGVMASESDWDAHQVDEWMPGVFEMPSKWELVDLRAVRQLIGGGERAEYPKRVQELYKLSRDPFNDETSLLRLATPVLAFLGTLIVLWQIAEQSSGGGGGGSSVSYGALMLLLSLAKPDIDWKHAGKMLLLVLPLPVIFFLIFVFVNPITAIIAYIVLGMGFWALPLFSLITRASDRISGGMARTLYLKLGLEGYERPVLVWTPEKYTLKEFSELDDTANVKWYGLAGSLIGFTYLPDKDSFGADVIENQELEAATETAIADGGNDKLPAGYQKSSLQRDIYGLFVPSRIKDSKLYLRTDIALSRMRNAAIGEKSLRRLLWSKEEFGAGNFGLSDKQLLLSTVGSMIAGAALGVWLFFL